MTIIFTIPDAWVPRLRVLGPADQPSERALEDVILELLDHAQQGVYRPGSWERGWLAQAYGESFISQLEPDTDRLSGDGRVIFQRPRRST